MVNGTLATTDELQDRAARNAHSNEADAKAMMKVAKARSPPPPQSFSSDKANLRDTGVIVPLMFVEYKKPSMTFLDARNQTRLYSTASVQNLAAMGIIAHPVFALATDNVIGHVFLAWRSESGVSSMC